MHSLLVLEKLLSNLAAMLLSMFRIGTALGLLWNALSHDVSHRDNDQTMIDSEKLLAKPSR